MESRFQSAHTELALGNINLPNIKVTGKGTCDGGVHPAPPLHDYPLLAWCHTGHPVHAKSVFTSDQKASVNAIAMALPTTPDFSNLAKKFGTDEEHVRQAVAYAIRTGVLG